MKVVTVGGGPAGLYFALLMKKANPAHEIIVLERNAPNDTFGWGVVFSDQTLGNLQSADPESYREITEHFAHWDDIDVHVRDTTITSGGHGFSGIARKTLLDILQRRAKAVGVDLRFRSEFRELADLERMGLSDADLVVAADGANSMIRRELAEKFVPDLDTRTAKFIWLGTDRRFDAFTFIFVETRDGVFQVHAYRFDDRQSAFIVECDEASWKKAGLDALNQDQAIQWCEKLFAPWLDGHRLMSNAAHMKDRPWTSFVRVKNDRWWTDETADTGLHTAGNRPMRVVLVGDSAHTAHFSIGSGTKLAMEDAIVLAASLETESQVPSALDAYQSKRMTEALRLQSAARNSMEWFENVKRYTKLEPQQFAYSLLTRSQRVSHENLRLRDGAYLTGVERWFASKASGSEDAAALPPMFTPFRLRGMTVANRVVVAPMDMYSAQDGMPGDFHLVHLGSRALGGAGLVFTEMVCTSPEARITPGCTGMYTHEHEQAWRRIVKFVHGGSSARICLQLGHSGRKGSVKVPWEGNDVPLDADNWDVLAPSALRHAPQMHLPREMNRVDMEAVRDDFVRAAQMGVRAGFDMIELHCAHGYLLSSFITPLSNRRSDEYGGSLANRLRFPLEVFAAMRAVVPEPMPMSVRISATDWVNGGITGDESVQIGKAFGGVGADIIHVSTGQTSIEAKPVYGRMWQTPYSDRIRNECGLPTIAVGNITEPDQVNAIIAAGRADLCALARPHLSDPHWTLHAAATQRVDAQPWPVQYLTGKQQLERQLARAAEQQGGAI